MELLNTFALVALLVSALAIIVLVLMQHGKGADMGAAFGSGSSGSLFGASGSANFLSRATAVSAAVFFSMLMLISYLHVANDSKLGVMDSAIEKATSQIPGGAAKGNASGVIPE
ncbi:preprotein translocase subunit SecG [Vogesella sp. XCS3]|jgi:preprotein translocase subunit SecG|uniref:preprotein translocase subunit SecG n=1 Tax=Vogesella sp. XCS3 TaxID=2877939 RepID=UPI001D0B7FE4|nr:preprotein translocase subunit SecG [Vogesella sp. XCS3]UDM16662.1 preprotein translocase subunit SecG [Vogesella sp. XCS3]